MSLEAALAAMLVDCQIDLSAADAIDQIAVQFKLSAAEADLLLAIPGEQLIHARREVLAKRWQRFRAIIPVTSALLDLADAGRSRQRFLQQTAAAAVSPGTPGWRSREAQTLARWVTSLPSGTLPEALIARANLDHAMLQLKDTSNVSKLPQAGRLASRRDIAKLVPTMNPSAVYIRSDYDVTSLGPESTIDECRSLEPRAAVILLIHKPATGHIQLYRLGTAIAVVLDHCSGNLTGSEICRVIGQTITADRERVLDSLCMLARLEAIRCDL
jgi:hypothetical protein